MEFKYTCNQCSILVRVEMAEERGLQRAQKELRTALKQVEDASVMCDGNCAEVD